MLDDGIGDLLNFEIDRDLDALGLALGPGRVGLPLGALRMNARERINCLLAHWARARVETGLGGE